MQQIVITDPVGLRQAIHFAQENKCAMELAASIMNLLLAITSDMVDQSEAKYKSNGRNVVANIGRDFAPYSFAWHIMGDTDDQGRGGECIYNGGLIYHGPGSPGDGSAPAYSVSLSYVMGNAPTHSWSIHT